MRVRTRVSSYGGVSPIPLYTKPAHCGGSCIYCPNITGIPTSYIVNEDTLYAQAVGYAPSYQFERLSSRISSSEGHGTPLEIIILGGSFSALGRSYRREFVSDLYLHIEKLRSSRYISFLCSIVTVESRPNQITQDECDLLRELGVSKVEIGVQHVEDKILCSINRGHLIKDVIFATHLLKRNGFKVGYHVMLGLPEAKYEDDCRMLKEALWRPELSPDFLKIYPCELLRDRRCQPRLWKLYESGLWLPPNKDYIRKVLIDSSESIPKTVRISRIMRQFYDRDVLFPRPKDLHNKVMKTCKCIRCREAGKTDLFLEGIHFAKCRIEKHENANDLCLQLMYRNALVALARIYKKDEYYSILRELRVYGPARNLGTKGIVQGNGIGSRLLEYVEYTVRSTSQKYLLVNASIGAHGFFLERGYYLNSKGYLQKSLETLKECPTNSPKLLVTVSIP